ncbi:MAG: PEGA domain-containing protein, partial [Polyangiales bacterium]
MSGSIAPDRLAVLTEVDGAMAQASVALAELDESRALRELARAERALSGVLALTGAALFYAEVQLRIGVSAAQLGVHELARAAFARAARIDPERSLLPGEAAPEVVALARLAREQVSNAPEGEVRIAVAASGARVFVDDIERGVAPIVVRARTGLHVLRIDAPGYTPYGCLFDVTEGRRPEQRWLLAASAASPAARERALQAFERAALGNDTAAIVARAGELLAVAPELDAVAFAERALSGARGLFVRCSRA